MPKITEYKTLVSNYTDEFQAVLSKLSNANDLEYTAKQLQSIEHEERGKRMAELWIEIQSLMRNEIDYYKK